MVPHMGRLLRIDDPGGWHHVMNRGSDHQTVYLDDAGRLVFERLLGEACIEHDIEIHAYCLMGNHFHLLVHCPQAGLSAMMQQVLSSYTRIVNEHANRDGALFRGRFHSVPVTSEHQILLTAAYVHRNPVEFVPPAALGAYRWSSYGVYLGKRVGPTWLKVDYVSSRLSGDDHRALVARRLPEPGMLHTIDAWSQLDQLVGTHTEISNSTKRALRLVIAADVVGASSSELADRLGLASPAAARTALTRARQHLATDDSFRQVRDHIEAAISM